MDMSSLAAQIRTLPDDELVKMFTYAKLGKNVQETQVQGGAQAQTAAKPKTQAPAQTPASKTPAGQIVSPPEDLRMVLDVVTAANATGGISRPKLIANAALATPPRGEAACLRAIETLISAGQIVRVGEKKAAVLRLP